MHSLLVFGPLPPPRHGVSSVNEAVAGMMAAQGVECLRLNTSSLSLERSLKVRFQRLSRVVIALGGVMRHAKPGNTVYLSLSGGFGLVYEALGSIIARARSARVVVHHHSFRYLDTPFWPMRLLVRAAGTSALHVTLGPRMAAGLKQCYPRVGRTLILSNAGLIVPDATAATFKTSAPVKVGLLSNLSTAKGLDDFIALAEASQARGLPWQFVLAGPFENSGDDMRVRPRLSVLRNLEYRGPLYSAAKARFLAEIDVFAFPTRYRNEAEPLVVLEALGHGVPVIAYARGCIADMLGDCGGSAFRPEQDFVACALEQLEMWRVEGVAFQKRREAARERFEFLREQSRAALPHLLDFMGVTAS